MRRLYAQNPRIVKGRGAHFICIHGTFVIDVLRKCRYVLVNETQIRTKDMTLETNTIAQMTDAEKAFVMKCFAEGDMVAAGEVIKEAMIQAVEKETRMAENLLKNPRNLAAFSEIVYDMAAA
jgi:hypothetical protein